MNDGGNVLAVRLWTKASNETAMETCVREHGAMVFRIAYSVLRNPQDAEDAAQETFLRALRSGKSKDVADARAWLAKIAWRTALDHRRNENIAIDAIAEPAALSPGAEENMLREERVRLLQELIRSLPRELQDVVTLSTVEELSGADVAEVLGIPEVSVRTRMHRARNLMRDRLEARLRGSERGQS